MIKVVIFDNKRVIESVYPNPGDDVRIAWAQEGPDCKGWCAFTEGGELLLAVDKDDVFELLIRAALNHLDLVGVETGVCKNKAMFPGLYTLGFRDAPGGGLTVNIKEFFKPCGGCGHSR